MISRSRSAPTAAAMSIDCTTSANSTVTCLYSADLAAGLTGAPHLLQNRESGGSSVPHDPHTVPLLSPHRDRSPCRPRQYRVTAGKRCPSYLRGTSDTKFPDSRMWVLRSTG